MRKNFNLLVSLPFLLGLFLLLFNDFYLKGHFHNALTGKLSDFAGLFVFPLFFVAFSPRLRRSIYIMTVLLFVFWKSPFSQPLIDVWNGLPLFKVWRAVDYTDLLALLVLPLSYFHSKRSPPAHRAHRFAPLAVALVAVFAFTATQRAKTEIEYGDKYYFDFPRTELFKRINQQNLIGFEAGYPPSCCPKEPVIDTYTVKLNGLCGGYRTNAGIRVGEEGKDKSSITLLYVQYDCPSGKDDKQKILKIFEVEVVDRLK
ncbi:MAG: hypothetical protein H0X14_07155 [Acidobacteria bacterium]|nr:hypothetical protein [Acidobacteriota bacterium]